MQTGWYPHSVNFKCNGCVPAVSVVFSGFEWKTVERGKLIREREGGR